MRIACLHQQVYGQLERALSLLKERDLLSAADIGDIALTSWATVHGLATLLVDGQVRMPAGVSEKDVQAFARRVLVVQADGFLRDGVRLTRQAQRSSPPGSAKKARKPR